MIILNWNGPENWSRFSVYEWRKSHQMRVLENLSYRVLSLFQPLSDPLKT